MAIFIISCQFYKEISLAQGHPSFALPQVVSARAKRGFPLMQAKKTAFFKLLERS